MVTDHAHLIALNRLTGALLWETEMADWRQNYNATGAPLAVGDLVVSGIVRRRRGRARVRRRVRSGHRQGGVAVLDRAAPRRARLGDVEGQRHRTSGRRHVDDRHLRCRARHALLAGRQSGPGLHRRRSARRQPLHRFDRRARPQDRHAASGTSSSRRTTSGTTTRRSRSRWWTRPGRASRASCWCRPTATASSTCSIAPTASSCPARST